VKQKGVWEVCGNGGVWEWRDLFLVHILYITKNPGAHNET